MTIAATTSCPKLWKTAPHILTPVTVKILKCPTSHMLNILKNAPAKLYIIIVILPNKIPARIIRPPLTIMAGFHPNLLSTTIVTKLARPSLIPGTAKLNGTRLSR